MEDDDQDILDQHVSRVFKDQTPHRSPGTLSPYPPPVPSRRRHDSGILSDATGSIGLLLYIQIYKPIILTKW